MMTKLLSVAIFAIFGVGACCVASDGGPTKLDAEDDVVLEIVLNALTTYEGRDRPLSLGRNIPRAIHFSRAVPRWAFLSEPLTQRKVWPLMDEQEQGCVRCAITDAENRHPVGSSAWRLRPSSDRILIVEDPKIYDVKDRSLSHGTMFPIQAWPPGYSENGICAVVRLYFAELLHPSYATYVLVREQGQWKIQYHAFVTYP